MQPHCDIAVEEDQHTCIDCGNPWSLEHDHQQAHALDGESTYANDGLRCPTCHLTKTKAEAALTIRAGIERSRAQARAAASAGP